MKLIRHGKPGEERPGLIDAAGRMRDLSEIVPDIAGAALASDYLEKLAALDAEALPLVPAGTRPLRRSGREIHLCGS
jgi:2,4-diketo-3-deoxy-L-fuconate hydrolase